MRATKRFFMAILAALALAFPAKAQWLKQESVLNSHTWFKIGVTEDGVYAIDQAMLQSLGLDVDGLDPSRIRLFGNKPGALPEENSQERYDDLSEIPIKVNVADDGSMDLLFFGHGPVNMVWNTLGYYAYEPNLYTDTAYYFLCVDSDEEGLRIQENQPISTDDTNAVFDSYLDYLYHESEELSPYASGRTWYGDLITAKEGSVEFVFELNGIVKSKKVRLESKSLGRSTVAFDYTLKVNGKLVDKYKFKKYGDHEYGEEHKTVKSFFLDTDTVVLRYEIDSTTANPMLFNDFFVLNFWRELHYDGGGMAFMVNTTSTTAKVVKVQLDNVGPEAECWDVTDPVFPYRQPLEYQSGGASFGVSNGNLCEYYLFDSSGIKSVASCYRINNQNLHGITDAELLIITPRVFWQQSEALAEFHRVQDSMNCRVVDIQEINNEFGTGVQDPTALRDFIRMVFMRSDGNLKYVLLMGKGTHDYRDIKGAHNNFVPTYETAADTHLEVYSMCSDDYFGLMDPKEGLNCTGRVDLGIGRLPIITPEQGDAMVAKIKHYADLSVTQGIWKNSHLLMADNDSKTYAEHTDKLDYILDTSWRVAITKKLYIDSFKIVSTPSGQRVPEANAKLMDFFDKGVGVFSYTGHGGVKSLTSEWVLGMSDILALDNYDRLPFVHTATCEFSQFDNPNLVSAGELLMLNTHGGAIAMLTTIRPTLAPNNLELSKALHDHMYERIDNKAMRFGDICRIAKSDAKYYKKANIVYVLFGDPALRFSYPSQLIQTEKVNGASVLDGASSVIDTCLGAFEGYIAGIDTEVDTLFNGLIDVRVYDIKTKYTTLGNFSDPREYSFYNDILFEGKANVKDGRFSIQFPVPADINYGSGMACVSYYAYDSVRKVEANGVFDRLEFNLPDSTAIVDDQGPEIKMYWNNSNFENGDVVVRRGVLYADLFDEHGIYHYNVSIGRDIVLKSNLPDYDNIIINDWYEPSVDDYRRGRIVLPVRDLEDGTYEFKIKVWDTQNNSSEAEISFEVRRGAIMAKIRNYPNPFKDETWFTFDHGDMTGRLSVTIEIFDVLGRQVANIQQDTDAEIGVVNPIRWDGSALHSGVYLYRMTVTDAEGRTRNMSQRMIKQ